MDVTRRGRSTAVLGLLVAGAIGIISSTQTWLTVARADGSAAIEVPGAAALPLLAPLSLAVLALGAALSLAGPVLRLIFGVLATAAGLFLGWSTLQILIAAPDSAIAATVAETTGVSGGDALASIVQSVSPSAWPVFVLLGWVILLSAAVLVLVTWRRWKAGGRKYRTESAAAHAEGPVDAVDSWDDLSRGTDPTR